MFDFINRIMIIVLMMSISGVARADLDFFSHFILSNKKYEKYMAVRFAVVTEDDLIHFFSSKNFPVEPKKNRELYSKNVFLIVQCKNFGKHFAFGEMQVKVQGRNFLIPIHVADLPGEMTDFYTCAVIYIGHGIVLKNDDLLKITYHWKKLYTL